MHPDLQIMVESVPRPVEVSLQSIPFKTYNENGVIAPYSLFFVVHTFPYIRF